MEGEIGFLNPNGPERVVIRIGQRYEAGRSPETVLSVRDPSVSRRHAQIELRPDGFWIADLNSRNGTWVDGERLEPFHPTRIEPDQAVLLGSCQLALSLGDPNAVTPAVPVPREQTEAPRLPLDEFEILGELGRGAIGVVYSAKQLLMNRRVAIKCLSPRASSLDHERFLREARLGFRVRSPYVVELYDARVVHGRAILIMELVEGMSLSDPLQRGPLPVPRALQIAHHVAQGLAAVHAEGVVHRDVKPSNVLLGPRGDAKLTDFGIALDVSGPQGEGLTPSGLGVGTFAYVAPEQAMKNGVTGPLSDVFGLGATLYHMISGRSPRPPSLPPGSSVARMVHARPKPLRERVPGCPDDVAELVGSMLGIDVAERPQSAAQAAELLADLCLKHPTQAKLEELGNATWSSVPASFLPNLRKRGDDLI